MSSATERVPGALALALLCGVLACGGESKPETGDEGCFVGEAARPVELEIVYRAADGSMHTVGPMQEVPLIQPPQGGKVMFIGVRARNVNGCGLTIGTALIEPDDDSIVSLERRPVTLEAGDSGWMEPERPAEASNYSNLPACPRADLNRSIEGEVYQLKVSITDTDGRKGERSLSVVPTCGESELAELCHCECSKDYRLGGGCGSDAGVSP